MIRMRAREIRDGHIVDPSILTFELCAAECPQLPRVARTGCGSPLEWRACSSASLCTPLTGLIATYSLEYVQAGGDHGLVSASAADAGDDAAGGDGSAVQWHPYDGVVGRYGCDPGDEADAEAVGDQGGDGEPLLGVVGDTRVEAGGGAGGHEELVLIDAVGIGDPGLVGGLGQSDSAAAREAVVGGDEEVLGFVDQRLLLESGVVGWWRVRGRDEDGDVGVVAQ